MTIRAALLQLNSSDDPAANLPHTLALLREAHGQGAQIALTPEVTNCVSTSRAVQNAVLQDEASDQTLAAIRDLAAELGLWVLIGSLALKTDDPDGRFANRSFLIGPDGAIMARYDKIHMFDVQVSETETYRESAAFRPGDRAVVAQTPFGALGLSICYDLRFPMLYRALAQAGAEILPCPPHSARSRGLRTGLACCAPAPLKTGPSCWRLRKPGCTRRVMAVNGAPTGMAWSSPHGARCCWIWVAIPVWPWSIWTCHASRMRARGCLPCATTASSCRRMRHEL